MLTTEDRPTTNWVVPEPDRVLRARRQEALLRELDRAEKKATRKAEASEALRYEAAQIRREALIAARSAGISASELAERLGVSVQRVYQLLQDLIPNGNDADDPQLGPETKEA